MGLVVIRECGHERPMIGTERVGDMVPCWSSCDPRCLGRRTVDIRVGP